MDRQTQINTENTVYLSIFINLLWYLTVKQAPLLCIQTIFEYLSDSSTQKVVLNGQAVEQDCVFLVCQSEATKTISTRNWSVILKRQKI